MARAPTDTIRFLTLDELGRLFAATRASARDRALFLLDFRKATVADADTRDQSRLTPAASYVLGPQMIKN